MAADNLFVRSGVASGVSLSVVKLIDRRPSGTDGVVQEWCFQREVEAALYGNGYAQQTGAVYRLLQRSGVGSHTLSLKKKSIAAGLVTRREFDILYGHLGNVRFFSLIPLHAMKEALSTYGPTERSEAVVKALGLERPAAWGEQSTEDEGASDGGGDDSTDCGGSAAGDSVATTEAADLGEMAYGSSSDDATSVAPAEPAGGDAAPTRSAKRQHVAGIAPCVDAELDAFVAYRMAPLNRARKGAAVVSATVRSDKARVFAFMTWIVATYTLPNDITLNVFASASLANAAQRYINELVQTRGRKWSYAANISSSLLAAARFVYARGGVPDNGVVAQVASLHSQCSAQARTQSKFDVAEAPDAYLDWDGIQLVRVAAEERLAAAETEAATLRLTRDVTVLRLLADQPPDRVGVVRTLKLGGSLKRKPDGSYILDLSTPGAHKTASVFGASRTSINSSISPWLDDYIELASIPDGGYLFHKRGDSFAATSPSVWSEMVKAIFKRHGDVALCPKDTRSAFVGFLRSGNHGDEAVTAAAVAMRHSSKMQASAAYDKGACDRRVAAAMQVAATHSAMYSASSSRCS